MAAFTIVEVVDVGDDVLLVRALDAEGNAVEATGWVSATTNHYDAAAYDAEGNRDPKVKPRVMTPAEVGEYALSLLEPAAPAAPVAPTPVAFEAPA